MSIDDYRIGPVLAEGGMATVHRGVYRPTGMPVAIKVLNQSYLDDEVMIHRFEQEGRIQNLLGRRHGGIVTCFEPLRVEDRPAIALEYIPGSSIADILDEDEIFEADEAMDVALQILDALSFAHRHGVIHRDIKSENLLLTPQGQAKLTDFGVARAVTEIASGRLTASKDLVGTMVFMAPEQLDSPATVDHRADLYSLGITLYEMVTGTLPFDGEEGYRLMKTIESQPPDDPRVHEPGLPECLARIILRALAKERDQRYESAQAMANALARCQGGSDEALPGSRTIESASPPPVFGWIEESSGRLIPGRILLTKAGIKIGRRRQLCDVAIPDEGVADEHALLLPLEPDSVLLIDLDSDSGTTIHNKRITRRRLVDGDIFAIGRRWSFCYRR